MTLLTAINVTLKVDFGFKHLPHSTNNDVMREKIDALGELIETTTKTVKSLSLRNLLVIFLLIVIIFPVYLGLWFLRAENRPFLLGVVGNTRVVRIVDNCPIVKANYQGTELYTVILPYNYIEDTEAFYMVGTLKSNDTKQALKVCSIINENRDALRLYYQKKTDTPNLPKLP